MTAALSDHLAVAIKNGPNSVDATYSAFSGGTATTVTGRFTRPPVLVLGVEANAVEFHCMLEDVPTPARGDRYTIEGTRYRVRNYRKDPVGGIVENELELIP